MLRLFFQNFCSSLDVPIIYDFSLFFLLETLKGSDLLREKERSTHEMRKLLVRMNTNQLTSKRKSTIDYSHSVIWKEKPRTTEDLN